MHERYSGQRDEERGRGRAADRFRGPNGRRDHDEDRSRGYEEYDDERGGRQLGGREFERDFDRDFDRDFERGDDDQRGRGRFDRSDFDAAYGRFGQRGGERNQSGFGGSEWRERFGGRDWEQPVYGGARESRRPFAGGHGFYGERSAPERRGGEFERRGGYGSWEQESAFGRGPSFGGSAGASWGGLQRDDEAGGFAGKGPKGYRRADPRIVEDASEALERDPRIDASEIEVTCEKGEIVLKGTVDSREAKRRAEECVESVAGVKDVRNELRVQAQSQTMQHNDPKQQRSASTETGARKI
jgi:hypothetical protein